MGQSEQQIITMKSSNFLIFSLAVVIAIASCAPKDSVDPFDVVPESDTLLQLKQQMADLSAQNKQQMADLSAQNSELRQRMQHLEERLTSTTTTSQAESLLQVATPKFRKKMKSCSVRDFMKGARYVIVKNDDKKSLCYGAKAFGRTRI